MAIRLGFAVAIHVDPEILLIDEILAVGDEAFQRRCMEWLDGFKARGGTIVLVSHSLPSIQHNCERAAWIENGEVRANGLSGRVVEQYLDQVRGDEESARALTETASREVELGAARLLNEQGAPTEELRTGDTLVVEMPYHVRRRVETPVFGVSVHTSDGLCIHRTTTAMNGMALPPLEADGVIRVRFSDLDLYGGSYRVSTAVYDSERTDRPPIDQHEMRYRFWVDESSPPRGLVRLHHAWEPATTPRRPHDPSPVRR
jgi:hypothetical protein